MRKLPNLRRKVATSDPKVKFVLFMEGKNTEPQYFSAFRKMIDGALVKIEFFGAAGCPMTIVEKAVAALKASRREAGKNSFAHNDQFWAVFDRDEHPKVGEALSLCEAHGIGSGYSNPCFELWLMLHKQDYGKVCSHTQMQKDLASVVDKYDRKKGKTLDFEEILIGLGDAERRAERQHSDRLVDSDGKSAPFTTVYRLTKAITAAELAHKGNGE